MDSAEQAAPQGARMRTVGLVAAGLLAGGLLGLTGVASAASDSSTTPSYGTGNTTPSGHHCTHGSGTGSGTGTGTAPSTTPEGGTSSSTSETPANV